MKNQNYVILVDEDGHDTFTRDGALSTMEKIEAHHTGSLHRAISVFIFDNRNYLLLQRRALNKYHSSGKWTNTCCTHPSPGESPLMAAKRRLREEMGLITELSEAFAFSYKAEVGNGLTEHEFDHVFFGASNHNPIPDPAEVSDWNWLSMEELAQELIMNSERYTFWLKQCFSQVIKYKTMMEQYLQKSQARFY